MLSVVALALGAAAGAVATPSPSIVRVSELRPGMKGWGLTVFRGTEPERFDVEILDVLHGFLPGQDLVLLRTEHPVLERARVVAGMSGSPIYLEDGRLVGAYAYGWSFGREPVAGATPIESMLAELRRPLQPVRFPGAPPLGRPQAGALEGAAGSFRSAKRRGRSRRGEVRRVRWPAYLGGPVDPAALLRRLGTHASRPAATPEALRPAATPLMLGGFSPSVASWLGEALTPFGLLPVQGGGSGAARAVPPSRGASDFVPGGALAVQLVRGDVEATGIGTVTSVRGRHVLAFGHPMLHAGRVGLPTATARVLHVLASEARSFKIGEALRPRGQLVQDQQAAIVVDRSAHPPVIPMVVRVHGVQAPKTEWRVELAAHRAMSPMLALAVLANALQVTAAEQADVTWRIDSEVVLEGREPIRLRDEGWLPQGMVAPRALSTLRLFSMFEVAFGNPFTPLPVERVEVDVYVRFERAVTELLGVSLEPPEPVAGEALGLRLRLRDQGGASVRSKRVPLGVLPHWLAGERITVQVVPGPRAPVERPRPNDVDDLIEAVRGRSPATSFVVSVRVPGAGLRYRGQLARDLPHSAVDALLSVGDAGRADVMGRWWRKEVPVGRVALGSAEVSAEVREERRGE